MKEARPRLSIVRSEAGALAGAEELDNIQVTTETELIPQLALIFGDPLTADGAGGHFTCQEADVIAEFLVKVAGQPDAAARWLEGHGHHDEDPAEVETSDHHYGLDKEAAKAWALNL